MWCEIGWVCRVSGNYCVELCRTFWENWIEWKQLKIMWNIQSFCATINSIKTKRHFAICSQKRVELSWAASSHASHARCNSWNILKSTTWKTWKQNGNSLTIYLVYMLYILVLVLRSCWETKKQLWVNSEIPNVSGKQGNLILNPRPCLKIIPFVCNFKNQYVYSNSNNWPFEFKSDFFTHRCLIEGNTAVNK